MLSWLCIVHVVRALWSVRRSIRSVVLILFLPPSPTLTLPPLSSCLPAQELKKGVESARSLARLPPRYHLPGKRLARCDAGERNVVYQHSSMNWIWDGVLLASFCFIASLLVAGISMTLWWWMGGSISVHDFLLRSLSLGCRVSHILSTFDTGRVEIPMDVDATHAVRELVIGVSWYTSHKCIFLVCLLLSLCTITSVSFVRKMWFL